MDNLIVHSRFGEFTGGERGSHDALWAALSAVADGRSVLLTCVERERARLYSALAGPVADLEICEFHRFCFSMAGSARLLPIDTSDKDAFFDVLLPEALIAARSATTRRYDTIIVDEDRPFSELWLRALRAWQSPLSDAELHLFAAESLSLDGDDVSSRFAESASDRAVRSGLRAGQETRIPTAALDRTRPHTLSGLLRRRTPLSA